MQLFNDNKDSKGPVGKNSKKGSNKSFFNNILTVIFVFLIIATLYSVFVENKQEIEEITISQLATDVISGEIAKIIVEGEKLKIEYIPIEEENIEKDKELLKKLAAEYPEVLG